MGAPKGIYTDNKDELLLLLSARASKVHELRKAGDEEGAKTMVFKLLSLAHALKENFSQDPPEPVLGTFKTSIKPGGPGWYHVEVPYTFMQALDTNTHIFVEMRVVYDKRGVPAIVIERAETDDEP